MCVYVYISIYYKKSIYTFMYTNTKIYVCAEGKIAVCLVLVLAIGQFGAKAPNGIALSTGHVEQLCRLCALGERTGGGFTLFVGCF